MSKAKSIQEENKIKVYNHSPARIAVQGRLRGYLFEPQTDGFPTFEIMSFEEIEYINSKSPVFRTGALRFDESVEEAVFDALGYVDYKTNLLTEEQIQEMLSHPTVENQKKILAIRDIATFERVRGYAVCMANTGDVRISSVMTHLLNMRFNELQRGIVASNVPVREEKQATFTDEATAAVMQQNALLMSQLAEMQEKMEQMLAAQEKPAAKTTSRKTTAKKTAPTENDAE